MLDMLEEDMDPEEIQMLMQADEYGNSHIPQTDEEVAEFIERNSRLIHAILRPYRGLDDYDDLFQIGCIGLCKAAQTDQPGYNVAFSTYAYRLIRNEIYTQLEYATRRGREVATDPDEMPCSVLDDETTEQREASLSLLHFLDRAEADATGVAAKGMQAIRLLAEGYSNREIGELFGVPANYVTAWVAKARKVLKRQRDYEYSGALS